MNGPTLFLLTASILCSTARAVFSKKLGISADGKREFFKTQAKLFYIAAIMLFVLNIKGMCMPHGKTVFLSILYGVFTVLAQCLYTAALCKMPVSVCAMVYSFGFIIPTVFGTIVWQEPVSFFKIFSVLLSIVTIVLSSLDQGSQDRKKTEKAAVLSLIISMVASGGLGIVQKLQQKSSYSSETGPFLLFAFLLAGVISAITELFKQKSRATVVKHKKRGSLYITIVGAAMAAANTANTLLAGKLPSVVVFPVTNVGVILMSLIVSVLFLKERLTNRQIAAIFTGIAGVILFNF